MTQQSEDDRLILDYATKRPAKLAPWWPILGAGLYFVVPVLPFLLFYPRMLMNRGEWFCWCTHVRSQFSVCLVNSFGLAILLLLVIGLPLLFRWMGLHPLEWLGRHCSLLIAVGIANAYLGTYYFGNGTCEHGWSRWGWERHFDNLTENTGLSLVATVLCALVFVEWKRLRRSDVAMLGAVCCWGYLMGSIFRMLSLAGGAME